MSVYLLGKIDVASIYNSFTVMFIFMTVVICQLGKWKQKTCVYKNKIESYFSTIIYKIIKKKNYVIYTGTNM